MEHLESQRTAADAALDQAVLDRIDEIVAPGVAINPADSSCDNPALGHSQVGVTLDLYSHVTPPMHREAARTFDHLLQS